MNRKIVLAVAGVLVVVLGAWYVALWKPATSSLRAAQGSVATEQAKEHTLAAHLASLQAQSRHLPAEEAKLARLQVSVPSAVQVPEVLREISTAASTAKLAISQESQTLVNPTPTSTSTTPGTTGATSGLQQLQLSLTVTGQYRALMSFLHHLGTLPRTTLTQSLQITASPATPLSATVQAVVFYDPTPAPKPPRKP